MNLTNRQAKSTLFALVSPFIILALLAMLLRLVQRWWPVVPFPDNETAFPWFEIRYAIVILEGFAPIAISAALGFAILAGAFRRHRLLIAVIYLPTMIVLLMFFGLFLARAIQGDGL